MTNLEERKERYLKDSLSIRIGGIAANLARVGSFVAFPQGKAAVGGLLEESKYFIEWTAAEFDIDTAVELVDLQRKLVRWHSNIDKFWDDEVMRMAVGVEATGISELLIERSGLLNQ